jgi:hypothetical protein
VVVRAPRLEARALLAAMERGDFYASTGVELADYQVSPAAMTITIRQRAFEKYRVQFIGRGGVLLREVNATPQRRTNSAATRATSVQRSSIATAALHGFSPPWWRVSSAGGSQEILPDLLTFCNPARIPISFSTKEFQ